MKKTAAFLLAAVLLASALFIAAPQAAANNSAQSAPIQAAQGELALAMEGAPALPSFAQPSAPGTLVLMCPRLPNHFFVEKAAGFHSCIKGVEVIENAERFS